MKKTAYFTGLFVATAALTATGALAFGPGSAGGMERPSFQALDTDGDGQITMVEVKALGTAHFAGADADGDGMLTLAELEAHVQKQAAKRAASMMARFDKDGDGALSAAELPKPRKAPERMFDHFDTDSSGGISEQEFAEAREKMMGHKMGGKMCHGDGHGWGHWGKNRDKN